MKFSWVIGFVLVWVAAAGCLAVVIALRQAWRRRRVSVWLIAVALLVAGGAQLAQLNAGLGPVLPGGVSVTSLLAATVAFLLLAFVITGGSAAARGGDRHPAAPDRPAPEPGPAAAEDPA